MARPTNTIHVTEHTYKMTLIFENSGFCLFPFHFSVPKLTTPFHSTYCHRIPVVPDIISPSRPIRQVSSLCFNVGLSTDPNREPWKSPQYVTRGSGRKSPPLELSRPQIPKRGQCILSKISFDTYAFYLEGEGSWTI